MDQSLSSGGRGHGGEVVAKCPNLSSSDAVAGEDYLSALPDDILAIILIRLDTIAEAIRTSVLSSRWRRIWTLMPVLRFLSAPDDRHILEVLAAPEPEAPALRRIVVVTNDIASIESVVAWLPLAARRLSGTFMYHNSAEELYSLWEKEEEGEKGTIALPCFGNATGIFLRLRYFSLSLPPSGAFARLTDLILECLRFEGTCELGDMVSSSRCPCLETLSIRHVRGLTRLTVRSESLLEMDLLCVKGLLQLDVDAPVLFKLGLFDCFRRNQPVANISAPQLVSLLWREAFDPRYVQFGNLGQLQRLTTNIILAYGQQHNGYNLSSLRLLQHFQVIRSLCILLGYQQDTANFQYLMEDITYLPQVTFLSMYLTNGEHAFGAVSFHVLKLCTGIRRFSVVILKAQATCPSGCICDEPTNWKNENLSLNCLEEVEITDLKGAEHEVAFLKRLFNWAGVLKKLGITFDDSVSRSKAKEFCLKFSSITEHMECYLYHDSGRRLVALFLAEDEGSGE